MIKTVEKNHYIKSWKFVFCLSFIMFVETTVLCLTRPPVQSASLPMSAKQQSVPSKVITDIMMLEEERKENIGSYVS